MKAVPLVEIAVTLRLPAPAAARPEQIARRLKTPRGAATLTFGDLAALGESYLALRGGAPSPAPTPLMQAASAYDAVCAALEAMRFTSGERGALLARDAARASLLELLGVHDVETA